ncbi:hypothetical protein LCGC14_0165250 [marine sediment metagenome]|uniref:Uncharacterized protein n=1 Tax=marine sediment metagenome TaxID=412755 RepID=A0A0F9XD15_9ZZZZ
MRKILMTLALVAAFACPVPLYAQEAPAPDQPAVTAPAEASAPVEKSAEEKAPVVTKDELKDAGSKAAEGIKEILKAPKTGDWKQDYLYPGLTLLIGILLALAGAAGVRHGMPYLRAKAKKAGIELDAAKETAIRDIIDDAIVLSEATALGRLAKDPDNKTASAKKAKDALETIKSRTAVLGIELVEEAIMNRLNSRHLVLSADPKSPVNSGS